MYHTENPHRYGKSVRSRYGNWGLSFKLKRAEIDRKDHCFLYAARKWLGAAV
jgi:hypothetical protein